MLFQNSFYQILVYLGLLLLLLLGLAITSPSYAEGLKIQSLSLRARVSEETVLGQDAPEEFDLIDVSGNYALPWKNYASYGWGVGSRLMGSLGIIRGVGENALVVALVPELVFGSEDGRFAFDLGAGGALFSRHRFGTQDYGAPFQFSLTFGLTVPLYKHLGIGYRFQHYSDAGIHGPDTVGADLHMFEMTYRL